MMEKSQKLKQQQAKEMENSELTTEALMERNAILQQRLRAAQQNQARQTAQGSDGVEMVPQRKRNKKKVSIFRMPVERLL